MQLKDDHMRMVCRRCVQLCWLIIIPIYESPVALDTRGSAGNETRYINHSSTPNCNCTSFLSRGFSCAAERDIRVTGDLTLDSEDLFYGSCIFMRYANDVKPAPISPLFASLERNFGCKFPHHDILLPVEDLSHPSSVASSDFPSYYQRLKFLVTVRI